MYLFKTILHVSMCQETFLPMDAQDDLLVKGKEPGCKACVPLTIMVFIHLW